MNWWARARRSVRNAMRREQPTNRLVWMAPDQPAGIFITPENALDISVAWACIMAIATALGASRWKVYEIDGETRTELPDDRLVYPLNTRPNPEMTAIAMREALVILALTWGNSYAEISRNARGDVAALWPLFSDRMIPRRYTTAPYDLYYEYTNQDGSKTILEPAQVYHLHGPGIAGLVGDNTVARMAKSLSLAAAQERFASTYFGNNTVIGGILSTPKGLKKETKDNLREQWVDKYGGPFKANKPIILEDGMTWTPFANDAETAQLVQSRTFQIEEICRWFGVPPHKVQHLARATFNNIEHLGLEFVRDALTPWARRHEQEADYKLIAQRAPYRVTSIDTSWLSQGDFKTRMEGYQIARNMGVYTANEIRRKEGENTFGPDGDIRIVPANMTRLELVGQTMQPTGAPPGQDDPPEDQAGENPGDNAIAREAVTILFASAFDRYAKRLRAREEDLRRAKKPDDEVDAHLAQEREKLRPWLFDECGSALRLLSRMGRPHPEPHMLVAAADITARGENVYAALAGLLPAALPAAQ
jgi:HK97 family phage portal protein